MGKVLVGCLVVVVLVVAGGGAAGYLLLIKPYTEAVGSAIRVAEEYGQLNDAVENRAPYAAPDDGVVQDVQFERFLAAHRAMRGQLEGTLRELDARYRALEREFEEEGREPGLRELFGAYRDLGELYLTAKRAQVDALNAQRLSLEEYAWIRNQAYAALGQQVAIASLEGQRTGAPVGQAPVANVELVSPHEQELLEHYVLAWFGL
jgi:hypothetical protein